MTLSLNLHKYLKKQMTKLKPRETQSLDKVTQLVGVALGFKPPFSSGQRGPCSSTLFFVDH